MLRIHYVLLALFLNLCLCAQLRANKFELPQDKTSGTSAIDNGLPVPNNDSLQISKTPISSSVVSESDQKIEVGRLRREWLNGLSVSDLGKVIDIYKAGGDLTAPEGADPRMLELMDQLSAEQGDAWKDDVDLDAGLKEVLAEMKRRKTEAVVPFSPSQVSLDQPTTATGPLTGFSGIGEESPEDKKGPLFGVIIVILFVMVLGVGMMARSS